MVKNIVYIYIYIYLHICLYAYTWMNCPFWVRIHTVIKGKSEGNLWLRPCKMTCCHANVSPDMFLAIECSRSFWNRANPVISPVQLLVDYVGYITIIVGENTMTTLHSHPAWILGPRTYLPIMTGWWFGTCFIFHVIYGIILPIDELICFKMVIAPRTRW